MALKLRWFAGGYQECRWNEVQECELQSITAVFQDGDERHDLRLFRNVPERIRGHDYRYNVSGNLLFLQSQIIFTVK